MEEGRLLPTVRFYTWSMPTVSLGRSFKAEKVLDFERLSRWNIGYVSRITGGGCVLHYRDLTYSMVVPISDNSRRNTTTIFRQVHGLIADALKACGFKVDDIELHDGKGLLFDCFEMSQHGELIHRGNKILGSAQKVLRGSLLQHGSLQLTPIHWALEYLKKSDKRPDRYMLSRLDRLFSSRFESKSSSIYDTIRASIIGELRRRVIELRLVKWEDIMP